MDLADLSARSAQLTRLVLQDRQAAADYVRSFLRARRPGVSMPLGADTPSLDHSELISGGDAVRRAMGPVPHDLSWGPSFNAVQNRLRELASQVSKTSHLAQTLDADPSLGELAYLLTRALQPDTVVETGVASGVTSAYILAALQDNARGELISIDLPPLPLLRAGGVGRAVDAGLRKRWTYHLGASVRLLPAVLARHTPLDMFVHDSDHSYSNMRWELETAWKSLRPGGLLVADDVQSHHAFQDVAQAQNSQAIYVEQPAKRGATGLMVRP